MKAMMVSDKTARVLRKAGYQKGMRIYIYIYGHTDTCAYTVYTYETYMYVAVWACGDWGFGEYRMNSAR